MFHILSIIRALETGRNDYYILVNSKLCSTTILSALSRICSSLVSQFLSLLLSSFSAMTCSILVYVRREHRLARATTFCDSTIYTPLSYEFRLSCVTRKAFMVLPLPLDKAYIYHYIIHQFKLYKTHTTKSPPHP
jgi:hypothetical protein